MKRASIALIIILTFTTSFAQLSPDRFDPFLGDFWFGIYMQEIKIGYAKISLKKDNSLTWEYSTEMTMKFTAGQTDISLKSEDSRIYSGNEATLIANRYKNEGEIGAIVISGNRDGHKYKFEMDIMGNKRTKSLDFPLETLDDYLMVQMKALKGDVEVGEEILQKVFVFDPNVLGTMEHIITLTGKSELVLGGLPTHVYTFNDSIPSLNISGMSAIDMNGNLIYQEYPSMAMVMKLESEETVKDFDAGYDIFANSIIKTEHGPQDPTTITKATYRLFGITEDELPDNNWVYVDRANNDTLKLVVSIIEDDEDLLHELPDDLPPEFDEYLKSEDLIQSDDEDIVSLANQIKGDDPAGYPTAVKINSWVYENINKQFSPDISNAVQTLKLRRGDCGEHSALAVALLRAAGIPARVAAGISYVPTLNGFGYHAWVEAYVGKWIQMDPTWGEEIADATHIMLSRGSLDRQIAGIMGTMNKLKIEILDYE